jgi:hypothetical protein
MCAVTSLISSPITGKVVGATRAVLHPPSDIFSGQIWVTDIVSRIDDTDFYGLSGNFSPERAHIDHVDAPSLGDAILDAAVKNLSIINVTLKILRRWQSRL